MTRIPQRQPWQLWSGDISDEVIDEIVTECRKIEPQRAWASGKGGKKDTSEIRRSIIRWVSEVEGLRDLLWKYAEAANHSAFHVSVMPIGSVQYTEYIGGEGGFYDPHIDVNWFNNSTPYDRKLSITVQLSDPSEYERGDFYFTAAENPDMEAMKKKGSVLVFPSYMVHAVKPVTKGTRKSLVCWFEGDRWR